MQHGTGIRERAQQQPGPASVVEMHVGQEHEVDRARGNLELAQRREQVGYGVIGTHVDECGAARVLNDVRSREPPSNVFRIDGGDSVRVRREHRGRKFCGHRGAEGSEALDCELRRFSKRASFGHHSRRPTGLSLQNSPLS